MLSERLLLCFEKTVMLVICKEEVIGFHYSLVTSMGLSESIRKELSRLFSYLPAAREGSESTGWLLYYEFMWPPLL